MIKRTILWILAIVGVLLIAGGLAYGRFTARVANPSPANLPPTVAGLPLTHASYGPAAVAEVTRLHGKAFPLSSGAFGVYGGEESLVLLWVAGAPARPLAAVLIREMERAIAGGESPFTPVGTRWLDGRAVYELTGMGRQHTYFRSGAMVVWLAADVSIAANALEEVMAFYP